MSCLEVLALKKSVFIDSALNPANRISDIRSPFESHHKNALLTLRIRQALQFLTLTWYAECQEFTTYAVSSFIAALVRRLLSRPDDLDLLDSFMCARTTFCVLTPAPDTAAFALHEIWDDNKILQYVLLSTCANENVRIMRKSSLHLMNLGSGCV